jgi:uncharacterized membrane protein (UPF0136 family)
MIGGLATIGAIRFLATKKFMPAVPLLCLGVVSTCYHGYHAYQLCSNSKEKKLADDLI